MNTRYIISILCAFSVLSLFSREGTALEEHNGVFSITNVPEPEKVIYNYYIPDGENRDKLPVLICIDGLDLDGSYFMSDEWKTFASKNGFVLATLGFTFDPADWETKKSYQYPSAWSGKSVFKLLDILAAVADINRQDLYFFGISAGAQFVHRFALIYPEICKAAAVHAAGGYTYPEKYIPTKLLVTVGEADNAGVSRVGFARLFEDAARRHDIDIELRIIPGLGHKHAQVQDELSMEFFKRIKSGAGDDQKPEVNGETTRNGLGE